ncbi:hypothetical protein [Streptomyces adustus]
MPRGRHRHSPPLHRLLPPSVIAGVSVVCAFAPWVFSQAMVLRGLAAAAATTAVLGAVVMRRWDAQAGKQVADLTRARASDDWRHEERVAELETDLEESRELRVKLEQRLRAKRAELARLRNEHAALLRRYATAETERATALEGRRLLEIESAAPARALPPGTASSAAEDTEAVAAPAETDAEIDAEIDAETEAATGAGTDAVADAEAERDIDADADADVAADAEDEGDAEDEDDDEAAGTVGEAAPVAPTAFSPEGSKLFLRAKAALSRFDAEAAADASAGTGAKSTDSVRPAASGASGAEVALRAQAGQEDEAQGKPEAVDEHRRAAAEPMADMKSTTREEAVATAATATAATATEKPAAPEKLAAQEEPAAPEGTVTVEETVAPEGTARPAAGGTAEDTGTPRAAASREIAVPEARTAARTDTVARPETAPAASTAVARREPAQAPAPQAAQSARPQLPAPAKSPAPVHRPSGHFTVPTAVAVVPAAAPVRRPTTEGGFDFFGMQKSAEPSALDAVQHEDLADVVGEEAIAVHKAAEGEFTPVDPQARDAGQVIDLTEHDETEQIDLQKLRSAAS